MTTIKSKKRVVEHAEVFTPEWLVDSMLDLVKNESERIDSRIMEPACGEGIFLSSALKRKLITVKSKYEKSEFDKRNFALLSLMSIYGIELLKDNIEKCHENLLDIFAKFLNINNDNDYYNAAKIVVNLNILQGDALSMTKTDGTALIFPEWGYLGKGRFQRRDFRFDILTGSSAFSAEDSLFSELGKHELFTPIKVYSPVPVGEFDSLI